MVRGLVKDLRTGVALHAGAVGSSGRAAPICGPTGAGKTALVAWLAANGFDYLSEEVAVLLAGEDGIIGLPRALVLKPGAAEKALALPAYKGARTIPAGEHIMVRPAGAQSGQAAAQPQPCIIEDTMVPVIIPASAHALAGAPMKLIDSIPHRESAGGIARDLQRHIVQIPRRARGKLESAGVARAIEPQKFGNQFVILDNDALYGDGAGLRWDDPTYRDIEGMML